MRTLPILLIAMLVTLVAIPVMAVSSGDDIGHAKLFENKYYNNNPAIRDVLPPASYGYAIFSARGVNIQDPWIYIDRDPSNKTANLTFNYDQTMTENQNPGMMLIKLMPNGVSEPILLQAGCWNAYMRRGNADQPEKQRFCTGTGATERVVFLGAAIPTSHKMICEVFTVIDVPGYLIHHDEVNHTVHHEATTKVVVDVPSHTEYRQIFHNCYRILDHKKWEPWMVKCNNPSHSHSWHLVNSGCTECTTTYGEWLDTNPCSHHRDSTITVCKFEPRNVDATYKTVVDKEPWDEIVVDPPAYDEQVDAITHEETVCNKYGKPIPPPNSTPKVCGKMCQA
jgi:hypothetical protein